MPSDKVVFTGDILFIEGHPILWAGPVKNWINACDRIISMEVDFVVPGHGLSNRQQRSQSSKRLSNLY